MCLAKREHPLTPILCDCVFVHDHRSASESMPIQYTWLRS